MGRKKKNKTGFGARLGFGVIYGACWTAGLLPRWLLYYPVCDLIYFLLYRVARYRLKVVRGNLAEAFLEKGRNELRTIEGRFYRNLAEYFIDAIDTASITVRGRLRRCPWPDENRAEVVARTAGRNWIALSAHIGSWELLGTYGLYRDAAVSVSAYRPLNSKAFDLYYKKTRECLGRIRAVPSNDILRFLVAHRDGIDGSPVSIMLIADQAPPRDGHSRWVPFLHHPTSFFHGGEKMARKFSLPLYYSRLRKTGRGRWEQTFELVWDGVSPTFDNEITDRYVSLLEEDIRRTPEMWLWSHRRWKRKPKGDEARLYQEQYGTDIPD